MDDIALIGFLQVNDDKGAREVGRSSDWTGRPKQRSILKATVVNRMARKVTLQVRCSLLQVEVYRRKLQCASSYQVPLT
jgi:hypothetical protein